MRVLTSMEQVSRIELPSQPWQGRILTAVLHLHKSILPKTIKKIKEKLQIFLIYYIIDVVRRLFMKEQKQGTINKLILMLKKIRKSIDIYIDKKNNIYYGNFS